MNDENAPQLRPPSIVKGALAGVIAGLPGFFGLYLYFCVLSGLKMGGDVGGFLLAAVTVIPLVMILTVFLPNMVLGLLVGLSLGILSRLRGAVPRLLVAVLLGALGAHFVFRDWYPWFFKPSGEDNLALALTKLPFIAIYGSLLGALTGKIYRRMS